MSTNDAAFPKGVAAPAVRALTGAGYANYRQLAGVSSATLLSLHGVGPTAIAAIRKALREIGKDLV